MTPDSSYDSAHDRAHEVAQDVTDGARELAVRVRTTAEPHDERIADAVGAALDTSLVRGGAAWDALRGGPVTAPVRVRRWPWAVGAALVGAAAGVAAATLVRRLVGTDAVDAQDPEDVQAVVDRPVAVPPGAGGP